MKLLSKKDLKYFRENMHELNGPKILALLKKNYNNYAAIEQALKTLTTARGRGAFICTVLGDLDCKIFSKDEMVHVVFDHHLIVFADGIVGRDYAALCESNSPQIPLN